MDDVELRLLRLITEANRMRVESVTLLNGEVCNLTEGLVELGCEALMGKYVDVEGIADLIDERLAELFTEDMARKGVRLGVRKGRQGQGKSCRKAVKGLRLHLRIFSKH